LAYSLVRLYVIERWFHFPPHLSSATVLPWEIVKSWKWQILPQIVDFLNATMPDVKCKIVTTLFHLFIIQLPISVDELKQRIVEVWHDLQQNIIDSAINIGAQSIFG